MHPIASALAMFVSLIVAWTALAAEPSVVEISPARAPDESGNIGAERVRFSPKLDRQQVEVTEQTRLITDVTKPTITIYGWLFRRTGSATMARPTSTSSFCRTRCRRKVTLPSFRNDRIVDEPPMTFS